MAGCHTSRGDNPSQAAGPPPSYQQRLDYDPRLFRSVAPDLHTKDIQSRQLRSSLFLSFRYASCSASQLACRDSTPRSSLYFRHPVGFPGTSQDYTRSSLNPARLYRSSDPIRYYFGPTHNQHRFYRGPPWQIVISRTHHSALCFKGLFNARNRAAQLHLHITYGESAPSNSATFSHCARTVPRPAGSGRSLPPTS